MTDRFALVALPLPLAQPYTYRIPDTLADRIVPGARVVVPVRRRELVGIATAVDAAAPEATARDILAAPDPEPAIPPGLLATGEWVAAYYGAPIGLTLRCMLPAGMWGESRVIATLAGPRLREGSRGRSWRGWSERVGKRRSPRSRVLSAGPCGTRSTVWHESMPSRSGSSRQKRTWARRRSACSRWPAIRAP